MADASLLPCPGCGFLIHGGQYGSYGICPFCNWEDCPFQLANPLDSGGPNGKSLVEHQALGLAKYGLDVREVVWGDERIERDPAWRPLSPDEIAFYERTHDTFTAVFALKDCYWMRSPLIHRGAG